MAINCVAQKLVDDWVTACTGLVVEGARGRGRSRKTWEQSVRDDMKLLGLLSGLFSGICGGTYLGQTSNPQKLDVFKINEL